MTTDFLGLAILFAIVLSGLLAMLGLAAQRFGADTAADDPRAGPLS